MEPGQGGDGWVGKAFWSGKVESAFWSRSDCGAGRQTVALSKVLSHNLYTVLHIPHDPVALEEHFRDDDDGPVSSQGYMPYLNKYILDKVGSFPSQHPNT